MNLVEAMMEKELEVRQQVAGLQVLTIIQHLSTMEVMELSLIHIFMLALVLIATTVINPGSITSVFAETAEEAKTASEKKTEAEKKEEPTTKAKEETTTAKKEERCV